MILSRKEQRKLKKSSRATTMGSPIRTMATIGTAQKRSPAKLTDESKDRFESLFVPQAGHINENAQAAQDVTSRWRSDSLTTSSTDSAAAYPGSFIDQDGKAQYSLPSVFFESDIFYESDPTASTLTSCCSDQEYSEGPSTDVTRSSPIPIVNAKKPLTSVATAQPSPDFGSPLERFPRCKGTRQCEEASTMPSMVGRSDSTTLLIFPLSPVATIRSPQTPKAEGPSHFDESLYDQTPIATVRAVRSATPAMMRVLTEHADEDIYYDDDVFFSPSPTADDTSARYEVPNDDYAVTVTEEAEELNDDLIYKDALSPLKYFSMTPKYRIWCKHADSFIKQVKREFVYKPQLYNELVALLLQMEDLTVITRSHMQKISDLLYYEYDLTLFDAFHDFMPLAIADPRPHFPPVAVHLSQDEQIMLDALLIVVKYHHNDRHFTWKYRSADTVVDFSWDLAARDLFVDLAREVDESQKGSIRYCGVEDVLHEAEKVNGDDLDSLACSTPELGRQMMPSSIEEHAREQHEKMLARTATMDARDKALLNREMSTDITVFTVAGAQCPWLQPRNEAERIKRLETDVQQYHEKLQACQQEVEQLKDKFQQETEQLKDKCAVDNQNAHLYIRHLGHELAATRAHLGEYGILFGQAYVDAYVDAIKGQGEAAASLHLGDNPGPSEPATLGHAQPVSRSSGSHDQSAGGAPRDGDSGQSGERSSATQESQQESQDKGKGRATSPGQDSAYAAATERNDLLGGDDDQNGQPMRRPEPVPRQDLPAFATNTLPFSGAALRQALFKRCEVYDDGTNPECVKDLLLEMVKQGKIIPPIHTLVPDTWQHVPGRYGGGVYTPGVHIEGEGWQDAIKQAEDARQNAFAQTVSSMKDMIARMMGSAADEQKRDGTVRNA